MAKYIFSQGKVWVEQVNYRSLLRKVKPAPQNVVLVVVPNQMVESVRPKENTESTQAR